MHRFPRFPRRFISSSLLAATVSFFATATPVPRALGHGTLVEGRMFEVRIEGSMGSTPAGWNESYYTWNQDSNNFTDYADTGFSYSSHVPDGSIAWAGVNDGRTGHQLDFRGLSTPSAAWTARPAVAGQSLTLQWVATAPHDPSYFEVFFTKPSYDPTTDVLGWDDLDYLGRWSKTDATHLVKAGTGPSPEAPGSTMPSYDWSIPIPATASGREMVVVIWQRVDPAGEAFFAVGDLNVTAIPEPGSMLLLLGGGVAMAGCVRWRRGV